MHLTEKARNVSRALIQLYGSKRARRWLWNIGFSGGRYGYRGTAGDGLYSYLGKYARRGRILDLGCGAGNTEN